jgi:HAD superfamily hydrolase (TIGR01549 family)
VFASVTWLFFDMGSTLLDETESYALWFARAAELTGGALSAQDIAREYEAGMARYCPAIAAQLRPYGFTGTSTAHLYPIELDRPYPYAVAVVAQLAKHYKLGIIANQLPGSVARLASFGLGDYFDLVVASAEEGVSKPDPRIFELALSRANCPPEQAVMIGDRLDNDIYPAKQLGMKTIRLLQGYAACQEPRDEAYTADATLSSLTDLLATLIPA